MQSQGFRRIEIFEDSMDNNLKGVEDMFRELQGVFNFGFGMFPELEEHMTNEMRRLFRPEASTSGRRAMDPQAPVTLLCGCQHQESFRWRTCACYSEGGFCSLSVTTVWHQQCCCGLSARLRPMSAASYRILKKLPDSNSMAKGRREVVWVQGRGVCTSSTSAWVLTASTARVHRAGALSGSRGLSR